MTLKKSPFLHATLAVVILLAGLFGFGALTASKTKPHKEKPAVPLPLARTITVRTGPLPMEITGQGTVGPIKEIQLVPQVSGKIVEISSALVSGGAFRRGDLLLRIDPADYRIAMASAEASLKDAESKYQLVQEEAAAAREEWRQMHPGDDPPALVAKEPQMDAAKALLAAQKANLEKARLQLERTRLLAPFNGRVKTKNVDFGQYVTPGQPAAVIYDTDAAEIVLPMEDRDLFWFHVPGFTPGDGPGSPARISAAVAGRSLEFEGRVVRAQGSIDERSRMVPVVVRVDDPYGKKPPLAAGLFVSVTIQGTTLDNAARIPRTALRADDTVWVVSPEGRLEFRKVDVARSDMQGVIVRRGLENGEQVVISPIKAVSDGMRVRPVNLEKEPAA